MSGVRAAMILGVALSCGAAACGSDGDAPSGPGPADASGGSAAGGGGGSGGSSGSGTGGSGAAAGRGGSSGTGSGGSSGTGSGGSSGTGAGGSSGTSGSAGSTGSGGAGAAGGAAGAGGDGGDCGCVTPVLRWERDGGRIPYQDGSTLDCTTYRHYRDRYTSAPPEACEYALACGAAAIGIPGVLAALGHADVRAAFARAPVFYGVDMRPTDGQVLVITQESKAVTIGADGCRPPGCEPIPAGVAALRDVLEGLDAQEVAHEPCASIFR